ncbi:MAG TPA: family 16 glycoside hydrolase [Thermoanaerobaculia bacterium]|nr:family 16 glycoside hydrolase [Thermoanaerobaculia bacterium]
MHPAALLILAAILAAGAAEKKVFTFDGDAVGSPPAGFEFARTGQGAEGKWVVRDDREKPGNRVLIQESADQTDYRFPLAVVKEGSWKDVTLSVRARPVSGEVDQGFGMVWRYKDANNYYITRCNADEDNCTIYHTVSGRRRPFQNKTIKVTKNTWHTLKLEAAGNHFVVWFDGTKVLDASDETFKDAGRVGLWTKADSVIQFDDFTIEGH